MKNKINYLAIIGSGPTSIYFLRNILDNYKILLKSFTSISIFEKGDSMGLGMPYNPKTTDIYNLSNISSEEIPKLPQTFANWLKNQSQNLLSELNVNSLPIEASEVYSRISLGSYFNEQYKLIVASLKDVGFTMNEYTNHEIIDIVVESKDKIILKTEKDHFMCSKVVIATGHDWKNKDNPRLGYYATPWPIHKILPKPKSYYNHEIGILGASLSAFDVVTSLSHRHGTFSNSNGKLKFDLNENSKVFKLILHAAEGWLPHLQYEQEEPFREIYRHTTHDEIFKLVDTSGFLNIETYFDKICRSALTKAFKKDGNNKMVKLLASTEYGFSNFIETMADNHEYVNSFEGMKKEFVEAEDSVENKKPIHWMETLDDLMYCLNFHAELLSAEDHLYFKSKVRSFLMNVIAALPLESAKILIALHEADCIDLVAGKVTILEETTIKKETQIEITKDDNTVEKRAYKLFINCSGNDNVDIENFPFKSLVKSKKVRPARAKFRSNKNALNIADDRISTFLIGKNSYLKLGGLDIDSTYRLIKSNGDVNSNIYDLSFTHTYGCRPYSYGLQACNATSTIVVESWLTPNIDNTDSVSIEDVVEIYDKSEDL